MGWLIYNHSPASIRDEIARLCTWESESGRGYPVHISQKGTVWYAAVRNEITGGILDDLVAEHDRPELLFPPERPRDAKLMDALDAINDRFGKKTMVLAREGFARGWVTRAELRSPRYTTRISDLPTVRI